MPDPFLPRLYGTKYVCHGCLRHVGSRYGRQAALGVQIYQQYGTANQAKALAQIPGNSASAQSTFLPSNTYCLTHRFLYSLVYML